MYLDNNATTMIDPIVLKEFWDVSTIYANPSSLHSVGIEVNKKLKNARKFIANYLGCYDDEIIFTSSGSEGNNLCLKGFAYKNRFKGNHIITTKIEHPSIIKVCEHLSLNGFDITYLNVDSKGFVSCEDLISSIKESTILISIGHVNNEIGTIQNLSELLKVKGNIPFHTDAVQSFLKTDFSISNYPVDMAVFSGHKFHAPKGIGFIYKKRNIELDPIIHGGGQEFGMRAGTENLALIHASRY